MELVPEFEFRLTLDSPILFGRLVFAAMAEGEITGSRINATLLPGSGDWNLIGADGWCEIDVRAHLHTDDGAFVYMTYTGLLELSETFTKAAGAGVATDWADQYLRTSVRFRTEDDRYLWLMRSLFVAEGRMQDGGGIHYRVSRVV